MQTERATPPVETLHPATVRAIASWMRMMSKPDEETPDGMPQPQIDLISRLASDLESFASEAHQSADPNLKARFTWRLEDHAGAKKCKIIRECSYDFALVVTNLCPDGREKALALTKIEEAMMWANAAISRTFPNR